MLKIPYSTWFRIGFFLGLLGFISLNIYSVLRLPSHGFKICFDCYEVYGFPFDMHETGTLINPTRFIWSGVIANITIAFLGSLMIGVLFRFASRILFAKRTGLS